MASEIRFTEQLEPNLTKTYVYEVIKKSGTSHLPTFACELVSIENLSELNIGNWDTYVLAYYEILNGFTIDPETLRPISYDNYYETEKYTKLTYSNITPRPENLYNTTASKDFKYTFIATDYNKGRQYTLDIATLPIKKIVNFNFGTIHRRRVGETTNTDSLAWAIRQYGTVNYSQMSENIALSNLNINIRAYINSVTNRTYTFTKNDIDNPPLLKVVFSYSGTPYKTEYRTFSVLDTKIVGLEAIEEEKFNFVLGNSWYDYKDVLKLRLLKETYSEIIGLDDFKILNFDIYERVLGGQSIEPQFHVSIYDDVDKANKTYNINTDSIIADIVSPKIKGIEIVNIEQLPKSYSIGIERIDFRDVKVKVSYENTDYETIYQWNSLNDEATRRNGFIVRAVSADGATLLDDKDYFNGTNVVDLTNNAFDAKFVISVANYFNKTEIKTLEINGVSFYNNIEIVALQIKQPYINYRVGERFLNENDTTKLIIHYLNNENQVDFMEQPLKEALSIINIYPPKETRFINAVDMQKIKISSAFNSGVTAEYHITVTPKLTRQRTKVTQLSVVWLDEEITLPNNEKYTTDNGVFALVEAHYAENLEIKYQDGDFKFYGYIDNIGSDDEASKVVLFDDYIPEIRSTPNISVLFPTYQDGNADLINKCRIGILFGSNNQKNRLFLSGNPDIPNADWYSDSSVFASGVNQNAFGSLSSGNYSYFSAQSVTHYGSTDNAVMGYSVISNDKLLVLKSKSDKETTVYFRTPTRLRMLDASGNVMKDIEGNELYQDAYALVEGNNTLAPLNEKSIINFNGDTLFLTTEKNIAGLDLVGIIGDNQRYANTRSYYIDNRLQQLDLTDAFLWSNNNYLFLSVKNVGVFVAHYQIRESETKQYEWWFLTSKDPSTFIEINDEIYFGNDNGDFVKMFNGTYYDIERIFVNEPQTLLSIDPPENTITLADDVANQMSADKTYMFETINDDAYNDYQKNIYYRLGTVSTNDENSEFLNEKNGIRLQVKDLTKKQYIINELGENDCYYLNFPGVELYTDLTKSGVELEYQGDDFYRLRFHNSSEYIDLTDIPSFDIVKRVKGMHQIVKLSDGNFGLLSNNKNNLDGELELLDIIQYGDQEITENFNAKITEYRDYETYFITAPITFGNYTNNKTIWSFTLVSDIDKKNSLDLGYASNKIPFYDQKLIAQGLRENLGIDFNDLTFNRIDFDKTVIPRTYTVNRVLPHNKFLCLGFNGVKGDNAILTSLAITYSHAHTKND